MTSSHQLRQWQTRTGIFVCVSTFLVTLPSTIAAIPLRPCETDEIAAALLGGVDDPLVRMILFNLYGFADDPGCASLLGHPMPRAWDLARSACSAKAPDIS